MNFSGRKVAIKLFTEFENHVLSDSFTNRIPPLTIEFSVQKYVQQYSWICFHYWLLQNKITNLPIASKIKIPFLFSHLQKCLK